MEQAETQREKDAEKVEVQRKKDALISSPSTHAPNLTDGST